MEEKKEWTLVTPMGETSAGRMTIAPPPKTLEGKVVLLRWNGKHNGDVFLNRIAELITKNIRDVKIIKNWEAAPETVTVFSSPVVSKERAQRLASLKPDISIASQSD